MQVTLFCVVVVLIATAMAAITDLWKFKVYNALTLPLLLSGLVYQTWLGYQDPNVGALHGFINSLSGAAFGFSTLIIFYVMGGVGAGDVKLLAGIGAWLAMPLTLHVFLASGLATGLYAVALMLWNGTTEETMVRVYILWHRLTSLTKHLKAEDERIEGQVGKADRRQRLVPFAAMTAVGTIAALAWSWGTVIRPTITTGRPGAGPGVVAPAASLANPTVRPLPVALHVR